MPNAPHALTRIVVAGSAHRYELRRGQEVFATGRLNYEQPVAVGNLIEIGGCRGVVRAIASYAFVVQLSRDRG